jgi:hypothetical protein
MHVMESSCTERQLRDQMCSVKPSLLALTKYDYTHYILTSDEPRLNVKATHLNTIHDDCNSQRRARIKLGDGAVIQVSFYT